MEPSQLDELTGFVALFTVVFTLLHFLYARSYRGCCRGFAISLRIVFPIYLTAILLALSATVLLSLYLHRLLTEPIAAGRKAELFVIAFAAAALFHSGFVAADRRRRVVAVLIASIPCFGNGRHPNGHRLLSVEKDHVRCFKSPFTSKDTSRLTHESSYSTQDIALERKENRQSNPAGITKRKVLEISCRTAYTWVYGRPRRQGWPSNVVRTSRAKGKRFVVVKDETIQDGAGADLLEPDFVQSDTYDKRMIAKVLYKALNRAAPCVLRSWDTALDVELFQRFRQIPAVSCMLKGELRQEVDKSSPGEETERHRCYVTELLWAAIMIEVHDYLQYKREDLPLLTWLIRLPTWLCQHDAAKIVHAMDTVVDAWKTGRTPSKLLSRPCDLECCCHISVSQTGCGSQCPCMCSCP